MKGHIRERSPGRWAIIIDVHDAAGKRKRRWHSFHGTKRQAQVECARIINEAQGGLAVAPSRLTVAQYLDQWLEHTAARVAPKTLERYAGLIRANIKPALGDNAFIKLQPITISKAYTAALTRLSPRTVHHMHRVLRTPATISES